MKSRLADLAHLAEIVGAFAVVVSLVYVGIQVNDGVGASRSASVNDANVALQSWYLEVGSNEQASCENQGGCSLRVRGEKLGVAKHQPSPPESLSERA